LAALQRAGDSTRLAACWYSFSPFEIRLSFLDTAVHRVSFYYLDWDMAGRVQKLDFLDSNSGAILFSQTISNFQNGAYITSDLQGNITARLTPTAGNAVLSGIFFDSPLPTAAAPAMSPAGGKYTNSVDVTITSSTAGSQIRYTLDGSIPTASSPLYSSPLTLTNTVTATARTFKSGMNPSSPTVEKYTIVKPTGPPAATVVFNGVNTSRQGSWKGFVGAQGYSVFSDSQSLPSYVTVNATGKSDWIWEYSTLDPRALQRQTDSSRMAACWYSSDVFEVTFNFTDQNSHRLSLHCVDWDMGGREQMVEIVDLTTGQVLHSYNLVNFSNGIYLSYTIKGPVIARFTKNKSYNAVLSGFFLDSPD
jgi:hypothetical protein